jgi:hypothetical protein
VGGGQIEDFKQTAGIGAEGKGGGAPPTKGAIKLSIKEKIKKVRRKKSVFATVEGATLFEDVAKGCLLRRPNLNH